MQNNFLIFLHLMAAVIAIGGSVVIVSYSSGELIALQIENGRIIWTNSIKFWNQFLDL